MMDPSKTPKAKKKPDWSLRIELLKIQVDLAATNRQLFVMTDALRKEVESSRVE